MLSHPLIGLDSVRHHAPPFPHSVGVALSFRAFRFRISAGEERSGARQSEGEGKVRRSRVMLLQLEQTTHHAARGGEFLRFHDCEEDTRVMPKQMTREVEARESLK